MTAQIRRRRRLHSMNINEISLVDAGANDGARVEIVKRRNSQKENGMRNETDEPMDKMEVCITFRDPENPENAIMLSRDDIERFMEAMEMIEGAMSEKSTPEMEMVAKALHMGALALEAVQAHSEALEDAAEEICKSASLLEEYEAEFEARGVTPISKRDADLAGLDPVAVEEIRKARAEAREAINSVRAKEAEDQRRAMTEQLQRAGVNQAGVVSGLIQKVAHGGAGEQEASALLQIIKNAGNVAANRDLLREIGDRGGDAAGPQERLDAAVEEIRKSAGLTREAAVARALRESPEAQAAYRELSGAR